MIYIVLFLAILFTIMSIRMLIAEITATYKIFTFMMYMIYIPTCILWTWFYYLSH